MTESSIAAANPAADYSRLVFAPHPGPLVALCVSPLLPELLLSVGDWTFRLWHHGLDSSQVPLFVSPQADEAYTAGRCACVGVLLLSAMMWCELSLLLMTEHTSPNKNHGLKTCSALAAGHTAATISCVYSHCCCCDSCVEPQPPRAADARHVSRQPGGVGPAGPQPRAVNQNQRLKLRHHQHRLQQ